MIYNNQDLTDDITIIRKDISQLLAFQIKFTEMWSTSTDV